mgnify:CR=1 FL=1
MAFSVPDYEAIKAAILRDIANQSPEAVTSTDSDFGVRAAAAASAIEGLYQHQLWILRQIFPDTADTDYLELHAALRGLTRKSATVASGTVRFTGTAGAEIPSGAGAKTTDGALYVTTAAGVIGSGGTADVAAQAEEAGTSGNLDAGTALTLTSAPSGVLSSAVVVEMLGGADAESDVDFLARLLELLRNPPAGGNAADYKRWALEVDGVSQAWVYPLRRGLGTVDVAVAGADGLPGSDLLAAVQEHIDEVRPVAVKEFWAVAPTVVAVDITAQIRISGVTLEQSQALIEADLVEYFADLEPGDTVYRSQLEAIITNATGVVDRVLTAPAANVETSTSLPGGIEWPRLGNVVLTILED